MQSSTIVVSCLLFAFASAQSPCRPCYPDRCNTAGLDCPGGIVYDSEECPCCYKCAQQLDKHCTPKEVRDNPFKTYFYCDEGLACHSLPRQINPKSGPYGDPEGTCKGTPTPSCPFGASFTKGCMNCTCSDGKTDCKYNKGQYERCPDPRQLPHCPNGAPRIWTPEACCSVCPFFCPTCENEPPILTKPPPESVSATAGNPFSFSFEVSGNDVLYEIAEPNNDTELTVARVQLSDQGTVISRDRVTVAGSRKGCYVVKYWNNEEFVFNVTVCVEYKKRPPFVRCDFEENMCGMTSRSKAGIAWQRGSGPTGSMTGPSTGNDGSEYYSFVDSSYPATGGDIAYLCTPKITSPSCSTLSFAYHMYGKHVDRLRVRQITYGKRSARHYIFSKKGNQGNRWKTVEVQARPIGGGTSTRFCFVVRVGDGSQGDIAIDNIAIDGMECPTPTPTLTPITT